MSYHTGTADLPLHGGKVPYWMLRIMKRLARAIILYIVEERGPDSIISMLSDPYWFQAFNNVIGMDWDSSGSTTVVLGILKNLSWQEEVGFLVLGGKGRNMRSVPEEADAAQKRLGIDAEIVKRYSKASARLDSSLLQDGYDIYIHSVIVAETGNMIVVQQGMNTERRLARRYHVATIDLNRDSHTGIAGVTSRIVLDASAPRAKQARKLYLDIINDGPRRFQRLLSEANSVVTGRTGLARFFDTPSSREVEEKPYYKPVKPSPRLIKIIEKLAGHLSREKDLLLVEGLGPKTIRALALIADIIYGVSTPHDDPVTHPLEPYLYAYAIGGKDGVPYRFDPKTAVEAYKFLEEAIQNSGLERRDRDRVLKKLREKLRFYIEHA